MIRRRYRRSPAPPVNVRLLLHDGSEVPVECAYTGVDPVDGTDEWEVLTDIAPERVRGVAMDELPGRCGIVYRAEP